jgi:hypothetical protein
MTRHQGFDVRVAPEVARVVRSQKTPVILPQQFGRAMRRLEHYGTRAAGVRKLADMDLWDIRLGDHRAHFSPVPGTKVIAVGVVLTTKTKRHKRTELAAVESRVHRWRDTVEAESR